MRPTNSFHVKKIQGNTLTNVLTVVYKLLFNTTNGTIVQYQAVVWKKESLSDHWSRRNAVKWATENLVKFPLCIPFGTLPDDHFPRYYQFRRLERYIVSQIYTFGLTWNTRSKPIEFPPQDIFNPELSEHEQELQAAYEASLPLFGYRRRRFNKLEKRGLFTTVVKPFIDQFAFTFGYIPPPPENPATEENPIQLDKNQVLDQLNQLISQVQVDQSIRGELVQILERRRQTAVQTEQSETVQTTILPETEPIAQPDTVQPEPIAQTDTVQSEPIALPDTVQPEPITQPETVQPEPIALPDTVQPEPIAQPNNTVQPEPIAQPNNTVQPEPITVQSEPIAQPEQTKRRWWFW
jgi:hypothetical protein